MNLHRRQFVLGPRPLLVGDSWQVVEVSPALRLSYCPTLPLSTVADADGVSWVLLGLAFQSGPDRPAPLEEVAQARTADVPELGQAWSGRWVLIGAGRIHMDASGLLGCFYREVERADSRELWVSSSAPILCDLGEVAPEDVAPSLTHAGGMDWYPPPRSRFRPVRRLLPSQVLRVDGDSKELIEPRPLLSLERDPGDYEAVLSYVARGLTTVLGNIARGRDPVWLSITGGRDSRVLLAAACHAGIELKTYTFEKPLLSMKRGDRSIPPRLARIAGYEHRLIRRGELSRGRLDTFEAHTGGHCVDVDRDYIAYGQWSAFPPSAFVVRGGVFGVGGTHFRTDAFSLPRETDAPARAIAEAWRFDDWHGDSFPHRAGISEWLEWVDRTPHEGLDWRDRLFHEQRMGGWLSSIEQGLDLAEPEVVHALNCHDLLSALASIPEELRMGKRHEQDLVQRLAPPLAEVEFNPPDPRLLRQLRWERRLYRRSGSASRYARVRLAGVGSALAAQVARKGRG